ncbi:hypothetical protein BJ508DRAFT_340486 [Ascobolus immersus RN42]|uniref:Uncharacterized protein n=1 Tax=Ascobolus immersus RN42 TaxID=1160509 RepID=A0A3N4HKC8_ASCIM|nr:hypothetical protein BJ508DRAFT_340486 [Ascobolus immersus RN42]
MIVPAVGYRYSYTNPDESSLRAWLIRNLSTIVPKHQSIFIHHHDLEPEPCLPTTHLELSSSKANIFHHEKGPTVEIQPIDNPADCNTSQTPAYLHIISSLKLDSNLLSGTPLTFSQLYNLHFNPALTTSIQVARCRWLLPVCQLLLKLIKICGAEEFYLWADHDSNKYFDSKINFGRCETGLKECIAMLEMVVGGNSCPSLAIRRVKGSEVGCWAAVQVDAEGMVRWGLKQVGKWREMRAKDAQEDAIEEQRLLHAFAVWTPRQRLGYQLDQQWEAKVMKSAERERVWEEFAAVLTALP